MFVCLSDVKLLPEAFQALDMSDLRLQKVQLILLTPQCSVSAVCNPVEYLLQENGGMQHFSTPQAVYPACYCSTILYKSTVFKL